MVEFLVPSPEVYGARKTAASLTAQVFDLWDEDDAADRPRREVNLVMGVVSGEEELPGQGKFDILAVPGRPKLPKGFQYIEDEPPLPTNVDEEELEDYIAEVIHWTRLCR